MHAGGKILVLAGAREAHGIVNGLVARGRSVLASLPEPERAFEPLPVRTRVGAFGSVRELRDWCAGENVVKLIDASHAFDDHISNLAQLTARSGDMPYLRVIRPPWKATREDQWIMVPNVRKAVAEIGEGLRVFTNTGWASLPDYAGFRGEMVFMRQTHEAAAPAPYNFVQFVPGDPPFEQKDEEELFRQLGISRLICRNVGGAASMSKLLAARTLGLRVLMVGRPDPPPGSPLVASVPEALAWEANA